MVYLLSDIKYNLSPTVAIIPISIIEHYHSLFNCYVFMLNYLVIYFSSKENETFSNEIGIAQHFYNCNTQMISLQNHIVLHGCTIGTLSTYSCNIWKIFSIKVTDQDNFPASTWKCMPCSCITPHHQDPVYLNTNEAIKITQSLLKSSDVTANMWSFGHQGFLKSQ